MYRVQMKESSFESRDTVGRSTVEVVDTNGNQLRLVLTHIEWNGTEIIRTYDDPLQAMNYRRAYSPGYDFWLDPPRYTNPDFVTPPRIIFTNLRVTRLPDPEAVISV